MCSASGFDPPAFALRIASSGSLTSGFCGAGSCGARAAGFFAAGIGASLKVGRGAGREADFGLTVGRGLSPEALPEPVSEGFVPPLARDCAEIDGVGGATLDGLAIGLGDGGAAGGATGGGTGCGLPFETDGTGGFAAGLAGPRVGGGFGAGGAGRAVRPVTPVGAM